MKITLSPLTFHTVIFVVSVAISSWLWFDGFAHRVHAEDSQKDLQSLFNPLNSNEVELVKSHFPKLRKGMTSQEAIGALGLDSNKQYPTTINNMGAGIYINMMLRDGQFLELLIDTTSEKGGLVAGRLGGLTWPNAAVWQELEKAPFQLDLPATAPERTKKVDEMLRAVTTRVIATAEEKKDMQLLDVVKDFRLTSQKIERMDSGAKERKLQALANYLFMLSETNQNARAIFSEIMIKVKASPPSAP